jgi:hypothetical protein
LALWTAHPVDEPSFVTGRRLSFLADFARQTAAVADGESVAIVIKPPA